MPTTAWSSGVHRTTLSSRRRSSWTCCRWRRRRRACRRRRRCSDCRPPAREPRAGRRHLPGVADNPRRGRYGHQQPLASPGVQLKRIHTGPYHQDRAHIAATPSGANGYQAAATPPARKLQALERKRVAVIGLGMFGTALGTRMSRAGFHVVFGSRSGKVSKQFPIPEHCEVASVKRAIFLADIVILAVPAWSLQALIQEAEQALAGKIVVETSNPGGVPKLAGQPSMGEMVAKMLPHSQVLKCFNTCSAYQLRASDTYGGPKVVELCGKSTRAKTALATMIYDMGFTPADIGGIAGAARMEAMPMKFFNKWRQALCVTFFMSLPLTVYLIGERQMKLLHDYKNVQTTRRLDKCTSGVACDTRMDQPCAVRDQWEAEGFSHIPASGGSKLTGWLSLYLLTATYAAGLIATVAPKPLYKWMIMWLELRKQLGLLAFLFGAVHGVLAVALLKPEYTYRNTIFNDSGTLNLVGEFTVLLGVVATVCLCVLGCTSLPSVASSMSWREWDFVHKKLGWASLFFGTVHVLVFAPYMGSWTHTGHWLHGMPPETIFIVAVPVAFMLLKLGLVLRNSVGLHLQQWHNKPAVHRSPTSASSLLQPSLPSSPLSHRSEHLPAMAGYPPQDPYRTGGGQPPQQGGGVRGIVGDIVDHIPGMGHQHQGQHQQPGYATGGMAGGPGYAGPGYGAPPPGMAVQPGMGQGYPPAPGGYPPQGGYPQQGAYHEGHGLHGFKKHGKFKNKK
eukprot:SM000207S06183  [mRNA]  locus=s207:154665:160164:+ [translate_table: standard]